MGRPEPEPLPRLEDLFRDYAEQQRLRRIVESVRRDAAERTLAVKGAKDPTAVDASDAVQGRQADCFLVASMAAVVQQHPDPDAWLRDRVKVNPDGTYTVTFHDRQPDGSFKSNPVTVSGEFAREATSDEPGERWAAVVEKAYAVAYGRSDDPPYGFGRDGGIPGQVMERLTGKASSYLPLSGLSLEAFAEYHAKGYAITMPTFTDGPGPVNGVDRPGYSDDRFGQQIAKWHVYYVNAVDPTLGMVVVHNVWDSGRENVYIPYEEFQQTFNGIQVNPVR